MREPRIEIPKEYLQDQGPRHKELEWPEGLPETPLRSSYTLVWKDLDSDLGQRILRIVVNEVCILFDKIGRLDAEETS